MSLYMTYNIMLPLSLMPHLSFNSDMSFRYSITLYNIFMHYMYLSFIPHNNFMLDMSSDYMLSPVSYNIHHLLLYMNSLMHYYTFMLLLMLISHIGLDTHSSLMPLSNINMKHYYNYSYSCCRPSLMNLSMFMLHMSDMRMLNLYYIFMPHMSASLSH